MNDGTIGVAARQAGVGVETVRFYERRGLIRQPPSEKSGYRQYSNDTVARIRFIRSAKELGFTLREIGQMLGLLDDGDMDCDAAGELADDKLLEIENKIRSLRTMKRALTDFKKQCAAQNLDGMCIIYDMYRPESLSLNSSPA